MLDRRPEPGLGIALLRCLREFPEDFRGGLEVSSQLLSLAPHYFVEGLFRL